jgi:hypothetical protein
MRRPLPSMGLKSSGGSPARRDARSAFLECTLLQFHHQPGNKARMCELETTFANINRPVFTRPRVDGAKPQSMQIANICGCKPVLDIKAVQRKVLRDFQSLRLRQVHIAHTGNAQQVTQHTSA